MKKGKLMILGAALTGVFFLTSCDKGWTDKDRETFMNSCTKDLPAEMNPEKYCGCVLEKLEAEYPNPKDVKVEDEKMSKWAEECLKLE